MFLINVVLFIILLQTDADCAGLMKCVATTCLKLCAEDGECDGEIKCGDVLCKSECTADDNCDSG